MDGASPCAAAESIASRQFRWELRRWRIRQGMTQRALAERIRFSRETVAAVESGRRYGSCEFAVRCDEALDTGGQLADLWPRVAVEQLAADGRRGPRGAEVARLPVGRPRTAPTRRVAGARPGVDGGPPGAAGPDAAIAAGLDAAIAAGLDAAVVAGLAPAVAAGPADPVGAGPVGTDPGAVAAAIDELRELVGQILREQVRPAAPRPATGRSPIPAPRRPRDGAVRPRAANPAGR
ncbi:helix-turn-helix transcriptional regulator [Plantactinospora siamensis]|uniref:Helix-turn-helix transcriptional regulator n=1 Tax=Plantactinospora siamensis TaxID=555372 RepID=A0ABV6NRW9_9ACTN